MQEEIINKFDNMIKQQAWKCLKKLHSYSMYEFSDLYNEGATVILKQMPNYNKEKACESTFFFQVLKSHFSNIVKKENHIGLDRIETDSNYILENQSDNNLTYREIVLKDEINNSSIFVQHTVNIALNPPERFKKCLKNKRKIHADEIFDFLGYKHGQRTRVLKTIRKKLLNNK